MEKIKFRAYDRDAEIFIYSDKPEADYFFEFKDETLKAFRIDPIMTDDGPDYKSVEIEKPEMFVGREANGKEIYESDIIEGILDNPSVRTMGQVAYSAYWCAFGNLNEGGFTFLHKIRLIEIIGSAHENPELLNA